MTKIFYLGVNNPLFTNNLINIMCENYFTKVQISEVEITGLEAKQNSTPQWLRTHDNTPLWSYNIFLKYKGKYCHDSHKTFIGRCVLSLKTNVKRYDDLVVVCGFICLRSYSKDKAGNINFVPKQKLICPPLEHLIAEYVRRGGKSYWCFDDAMLYLIENPMFSCNREEVPLVDGYNSDGLLDRVTVDMSLFQAVNS